MIGTSKEIITWLLEKDKENKYEIKDYKEKRKINANDYMWVICDRIAHSINSTKNEVYKRAIEEVGVYEDRTYTKEEYQETATRWERIGLGWFSKYFYKPIDGIVHARMYYGSSVYNTQAMSILIDYIVQEAKELDIETLTPNQLADLKSQWRANEK